MGGRRASLVGGPGEEVPDDVRCRRSDGKKWRCPQRAVSGVSFCEHHYRQARKNLAGRIASSNKRAKPRRPVPASPAPADRNPGKWRRRKKTRRRRGSASEELVAPQAKKAKDEEAAAAAERVESKGVSEDDDAVAMEKLVIDLPNGVMAISPVSPKDHPHNASPLLDPSIALGFDIGGHKRRRLFRSKNLEPTLFGSIFRFHGGNCWERGKTVLHACRKINAACTF